MTAETLSPIGAEPPTRPGFDLSRVRLWGGRTVSSATIATTPGPLIALAVGLACVVLGLSVVWRGDASETAAGFWPPAGAAVVALVVVPRRRWAWVGAGILTPTAVGFAFSVMPVSAGLLWTVGNLTGPALAALTLRWFAGSRWYGDTRMLWMFVAVAAAGPMVGGAIGSIGNVVGYGDRFLDVWPDWVLGDGLGILVVAPLLLSSSRRSARRSRQELAGVCALVAIATGLAFADIGRNGAALLPYLILVALVWAGMRFGTRSASSAGFVVALGANIATSLGLGPFAAAELAADIITLEIFLAIALVTSFIVATMAGDLADRDEVRDLLRHQATHDALTGLPNRLLLEGRVATALAERSVAATVSVMIVDLDGFKRINDRYGHPTGDRALRAIAELLARHVRPGDVLARIGGDEFAVLSTGFDCPVAVQRAATEMLDELTAGMDIGDHRLQVSATIGAATVEGDDTASVDDLMHRSEIALDHAKRHPGIAIALFDEAIEASTRRRVELAEELRDAVARDEVSVVYQPVISLTTGRVAEFEALARWHNRRFGTVAPDEFIDIAENIGLIDRIGAHVLHVACTQAAAWRAETGRPIRIAVNASARQLCDRSFPDRVRDVLAAVGLPPDALTLEITETAVMDDLDASELVLAELRELGVRLSMDDFGTGYSSMSNLRRTPLQILKIDRSFVSGLGVSDEDTAIVSSIVNLGHSFGLDVVAEGIETVVHLAHLMRLGCDYGQGFLWSPGVSPDVAGTMLRARFDMPIVGDPATARTVGIERADLPLNPHGSPQQVTRIRPR